MNKVVRVVFASLIGGALANSYGFSEIRESGEKLRKAELQGFALDLKLYKLKSNSQAAEMRSLQERMEDTTRMIDIISGKIDETRASVDALCKRIEELEKTANDRHAIDISNLLITK